MTAVIVGGEVVEKDHLLPFVLSVPRTENTKKRSQYSQNPNAMTETAAELLAECQARNVVIQTHGGRLEIDAPESELTPELLARLHAKGGVGRSVAGSGGRVGGKGRSPRLPGRSGRRRPRGSGTTCGPPE